MCAVCRQRLEHAYPVLCPVRVVLVCRSPRPLPLAPPAPQRSAPSRTAPQRYAPLCSSASQLLWQSSTSRARTSSATVPRLPDADRPSHATLTASDEISQLPTRSFLRVMWPSTPAGRTVPRITASHMLRSTMKTVSAPASSSFRGSLPHPTQSLCTLRVRRRRRLTQHSLPGGLLGVTWAGLAPADRASFAWRLPSFDYLVGNCEEGRRHGEA